MHANRIFRIGCGFFPLVAVVFLAGCEGLSRTHDYSVVDVTPPAEDGEYRRTTTGATANFADLVEQMLASREQYLSDMRELERAYLKAGDSVKANWCRTVRQHLEDVLNYPYLTAAPAEHRVDISPEQSIPEADKIFNEAVTLYRQVAAVPLAGTLERNKEKARRALVLFKRVLKEHPRSDKVAECAFYCGEIYKEYLREEDPDDELSVRYYRWAAALDPNIQLPARFQCAVVYDFRRHDRARAIELYHQVMELEEAGNMSNVRFSATRVEQLTDEQYSHLKPTDRPRTRSIVGEPRGMDDPDSSRIRPTSSEDDEYLEPHRAP